MPSIPPGAWVVEIGQMLSADPQLLRSLRDISEEANAVFVTSPSIVSVEGPQGPLLFTIGPGSLVFDEHPVIPSPERVRLLRLRRREWVDGCRVERFTEPVTPEGEQRRLSGVVLGVNYRDPVALTVNGMSIEATLVGTLVSGEVEYAVLGDTPLLGYLPKEGRYVVHVAESGLRDLLVTLAGLHAGCGGSR